MKRCIGFIGVMLCLFGLSLSQIDLHVLGQVTYYDGRGEVTEEVSQNQRVDFLGEESDALAAIEKLGGQILWREEIPSAGEMRIYYAYSKQMVKNARVGGEKVNIMVAVKEGRVSVGYPLLMGSYQIYPAAFDGRNVIPLRVNEEKL